LRILRGVPVTAVIFDLDNTLVPEMANYERAFDDAVAPLVASRGVAVETLRRAVFAASRELWLGMPDADVFLGLGIGSPTSMVTDLPGVRFDAMRDRLPAYRRESWRRGLRACGVSEDDDLAAALDDAFRVRQRTFAPAFPDALTAVRDTARRYRLVLATNGPGDVQRRKIDAAGLAPFFPAFIASGDIGHGKPDPRIFAHALSAIGANAADAVSVGDSIEKDVVGARTAGIRSVLVDRARTGDGGGAERVIGSLGELAGALASLG
jgi:putative hydrolase of the HAD superfamily